MPGNEDVCQLTSCLTPWMQPQSDTNARLSGRLPERTRNRSSIIISTRPGGSRWCADTALCGLVPRKTLSLHYCSQTSREPREGNDGTVTRTCSSYCLLIYESALLRLQINLTRHLHGICPRYIRDSCYDYGRIFCNSIRYPMLSLCFASRVLFLASFLFILPGLPQDP